MQQAFELPELDRKKTQAAVEAALEKYRLFKYLEFDEREASLTASYELREGGSANRISDQTADIAIHNTDSQNARKQFCERVERSVNRLAPKERQLITERYMKEDYIFDYQIYRFILEVSESTYYKIRWHAFYKLALALRLAVVKSEGGD